VTSPSRGFYFPDFGAGETSVFSGKPLTSLTFGFWSDQLMNNLPKTLTSITFGNNFNQKLSLKFLTVLKVLKLDGNYNQAITLKDLPLTLETIFFQKE
jgi:hypothetical protein